MLVYLYIFKTWGLTLCNAPFNHYLHNETAQGIFLAEETTEPKIKHSKDHYPTVGDTVCINKVGADGFTNVGKVWAVLKEVQQ